MSLLSACCFIKEAIPAGRKSVFLKRRTNKRRVFKEEYDGSMELDWKKKNPKTTAQIVLKQDKRSTPPSHCQPQNISHFYSRLTFARKHTSVSSFWLCGCRQSTQTVLKDNWVQINSTHDVHLPVLLSWSGNQGASLCSGCICFPPVSTRRQRSKAVMLFTSRYHTHIHLLRSAADVPLTSIHAGRCWANTAFPRRFLHSRLWLITLQQSRDFQLPGISDTASNIYNA